MTEFTSEHYDGIRAGAIRSAAILAPMILAHLPDTPGRAPEVIDVGCGEGWFSQAFQAHGCHVTSIDHPVPANPAQGVHVRDVDLETAYTLERNAYDLAVCLEVAEHLTPLAGAYLVGELCAAARVVAFSAAIPGQRGIGHVHERWPTYWAEVFRDCGVCLFDPWRRALWDNPEVEPWYSQNLLLGQRVAEGTLAEQPAPACLVHPTIFLARVADAEYWRERERECDRALRAATA